MTRVWVSIILDSVARAELKIDFSALEDLAKRFKSPALDAKMREVIGSKEISGLVAQAIAENFAQEGPGWAPLKGSTIRNSVARGVLKKVMRAAGLNAAIQMRATKTDKNGQLRIDASKLKGRRAEYYRRVDAGIEQSERQTRSANNPGGRQALGARQILRRTSLLFQTVTTPGFSGSTEWNGKATSGQNISKVEGTNLVYGTNLIYAATHNYGRGNVPKREFLVIHDEWKARLLSYAAKMWIKAITDTVGGK